MSREQLDVIDTLISMLRETLDEMDRYCTIMQRFVEIIDQMDEKNILERFL